MAPYRNTQGCRELPSLHVVPLAKQQEDTAGLSAWIQRSWVSWSEKSLLSSLLGSSWGNAPCLGKLPDSFCIVFSTQSASSSSPSFIDTVKQTGLKLHFVGLPSWSKQGAELSPSMPYWGLVAFSVKCTHRTLWAVQKEKETPWLQPPVVHMCC